MPTLLQELKVFIASPGGLDEIREAFRDTLREFNDADTGGRTLIFTPVGWELTLGGYKRPQELINEDLERCDYFVLVLWDRWGSPPDNKGRYTSGCEEEFHLAVKCAEDSNRPMEDLVVFFKEVEEKRKADPGKQLKKVINFRKSLEKSKKHLFMTFQDKAAFQTHLRRFLTQWYRDRAPKAEDWRQRPQAASLEEALKSGESQSVEFKQRHAIAPLQRAIAAFANTNSGTIFLGVKGTGEVVGIECNTPKQKDKELRRLRNLTVQSIKPAVSIRTDFVTHQGKTVMRIFVPRGEQPLYFLNHEVFVRVQTSNITATPEQVETIMARFTR